MLMGSVRVRAGPGCSSAWARLRLRRQVKQQSASALSSSGIAIWPASVHRRGKKRGIAHQSLFSRACLRGRTDWLPTPDGGRCLKFTVLSAGQALRTLWPLCCRTWSRHQVPLNASLEHGKLKQRCRFQSQPEWVYAAFIWQDSYTARVRESVADGRATLQSLWRTFFSTRRRA